MLFQLRFALADFPLRCHASKHRNLMRFFTGLSWDCVHLITLLPRDNLSLSRSFSSLQPTYDQYLPPNYQPYAVILNILVLIFIHGIGFINILSNMPPYFVKEGTSFHVIQIFFCRRWSQAQIDFPLYCRTIALYCSHSRAPLNVCAQERSSSTGRSTHSL